MYILLLICVYYNAYILYIELNIIYNICMYYTYIYILFM